MEADKYGDQEILFSEEDSFSTEDISLELSTLRSSTIYYTLDGSEPTDESEVYDGPLVLAAGEDIACYPVKAVAFYSDGTSTDVYTKTYFVGEDADTGFTTLVVSITGDPDGLFDYYDGILVTGVIRDYYVMDNPGVTVTDKDPANFYVRGDDAERAVYVEVWDSDGAELLGQDAGLRVFGGLSRSSDVKSLKLIARDEYGSSRFQYDFFQAGIEDLQEKLQTAADGDDLEPDLDKRLVLRNHGNDQESGYLRNELAQQLASDAGYPFTQRFIAASVWINGEYYGFEWLEEVYDDNYLETYYDTDSDDGSFQIVEVYSLDSDEEDDNGGYGFDFEDDDLAEAGLSEEPTEEELEEAVKEELLEERAKEDLREILAYGSMDLTDDAVFEELCEKLDIDNFLSYCAVEIYLANCDWPSNNIKAFRWYSDDDVYTDEEGTDGKWRFLFYDLDMGMARTADSAYTTPTLAYVLDAAEEGSDAWDQEFPLLRAVLQRADMRERFRDIMEEYMEGVFFIQPCELLEEIQGEMAGELDRQIRAFALEEAEDDEEKDFETCYEEALTQHQESIEDIETFFLYRADVIREELDNMEEYLQ